MKSRGFTILELLLATLVLSIIGTLTWGALSATFRTQKTVNERTEIQEMGTSIMMKLREDISQAFHVRAAKMLTFFRGEDNFDQDRISLTSLSHTPSGPDVRESDQCEIIYKTESNPDVQGLYSLLRRENPVLDGEIDDEEDFLTISDRVVRFNLEYKKDRDFRNDWDIRESEHSNQLPEAVKVTLVLRDHRERDEVFEALIDLPMGETLSLESSGNTNASTPPSSGSSSNTGQRRSSQGGRTQPLGRGANN